MRIVRTQLLSGAQTAQGVAVVIDVFRAFTCAPLLLSLGVRTLVLEPDAERARSMKTGPDTVLIGEINEQPIPGFDLVNSPHEILRRGRPYFEGKTVIHRTTAGVTGAAAALESATRVILGAYVTARAIGRWLRSASPPEVTLVAMGSRGRVSSPEDEGCADYLEHLLTGKPYDHVTRLHSILAHEQARKFLRGTNPHLPREDPVYCLQRDLFDLVPVAQWEEDRILVTPIRAE